MSLKSLIVFSLNTMKLKPHLLMLSVHNTPLGDGGKNVNYGNK